MIDIQLLRSSPELFKEAVRKKGINFDVDYFLDLDKIYRKSIRFYELLKALLNSFSKRVKSLQDPERSDFLSNLRDFSNLVKNAEDMMVRFKTKWESMILFCPNPPLDEVPYGRDDSENVPIKFWGSVKQSNVDHKILLKNLGVMDFESGAKVSGSKFYFMKTWLATLHHAILQYGIKFIIQRGFEFYEVPHIVSEFAMNGTGYFPLGKDQTYKLSDEDSDKYLIGTSEVPLCSMFANNIFHSSELPLKVAGYSPCYRREAGSYGKESAGLYRVHQFYKVEQVILCEPDPKISMEMHELLLTNSEDFVKSLELPYRVVLVCTGDLGLGQVYKHDIECWMPSRNGYGETHSCSSLHSFQARRLNIRFRGNTNKSEFVHTLNNTLVASPRILIPYVENHFENGKLYLVPPLRDYFGGKEYLEISST